MTDSKKLEAVATYLGWRINSYEEAIEVLDNIWYVVMEDKLKETI